MVVASGRGGKYAYRQADHYGIKAQLQVFTPPLTNPVESGASASKVGGLFRKRAGPAIGGLEKDSLTVSEFVKRTEGLFREVGLKHVVVIWIGNESVYRATGMAEQNNRDERDNLEEAFAVVSSSKKMVEGGNKEEVAGLKAHGFGQDFEMEFNITFRGSHPQSSPSITLEVLALPIDLSWRSGEQVPERVERLNQFTGDKAAMVSKGEEETAKMRPYIRSLQETLKKTYDAKDVTSGFQVKLEGIIW